jgi:hypothetical protein
MGMGMNMTMMVVTMRVRDHRAILQYMSVLFHS